MKFKKIIQRGQVLALYGVLIPLLFLFVGVGLDLGWYYLNVSRLQNAADAAALAGAFELTEEDKTMRDYFVDGLTTEPGGIQDDSQYSSFNVGIIDEETGEVISVDKVNLKNNGLKVNELKMSKVEARKYAGKNLYDIAQENHNAPANENKIANEWTKNNDLGFKATLYTRTIDAKRETQTEVASSGYRYYKVTLSEKIQHLFMPGWFDPMDATVVAWALIKPRDNDLDSALHNASDEETIQNVQAQSKNTEESYKGKWAHFQDEGVYYTQGDVNRTEIVNVHNDMRSQNRAMSDRTQNNYTKVGGDNNGEDIDSINLDFRVEYTIANTDHIDWDLRSSSSDPRTNKSSEAKNWTLSDRAANMRVLTSFNLNYAWTDRNLNDLVPDILWTHIEQDTWWIQYDTNLNSVHQIILNAKADNTETTTINGKKVYTKRPFVIFYMGPETYEVDSTKRQSQPVVLNLYNDWNGILYMPNSPVIINGNGHKLTGFVVAKEFRRLKTAKDMEDEGYIKVTDGYGKTIFIKPDADHIFTEEKLSQLAKEKGYTKTTDTEGNISFYEKIEATKYLKLSVDKTEASNYPNFTAYINATYKTKFMTATGLSESEIDTVTFPTGQNLCDDEIYVVAKTDIVDAVPANAKVDYVKVLRHFVENGEEKTEEKYIPKTSLPYVKVRRNEIRAYVSVYDLQKTRKSDVYGLNTVDESLGITDNVSGDELWQPTTDTYKSDKFINQTLWNNTYKSAYTDSKLTFVEEGGLKYFMRNSEIPANSMKLVEVYRKYTDEDGNVRYVEDKEYSATDAAYYMEVLPEGSYKTDANGNAVLDSEGKYAESNPIIVDNWGDLQTVPITPTNIADYDTKAENLALAIQGNFDSSSEMGKYLNQYTRPTTTTEYEIENYPVIEQPGDPGRIYNDKYRGTSGNRVKQEYKIPVYERVYYKSVFNLSEKSTYSYFQVENFRRVNYTYLNVDEINNLPTDVDGNDKIVDFSKVQDMFFTTRRAKWID